MTTVTLDQAINIGLGHHNAGRHAEAAAIYQQILQASPRHATALYLYGRLKYALRRFAEAADLLNQAVAAKPDFADAYLHLGDAQREAGQPAAALAAYQRAVLHAPDNQQAVARLIAALQRHAVRAFDTPHGPIRFACSGDLPLYRAQTLLTKEPETLDWIDAFDAGDVFWDVGANIGVYTLYAAKAGKAAHILAFEPGAGNYMLLNGNIEANAVDDRVKAYCVAFSDADAVHDLHMQTTDIGGALSSFGAPIDYQGKTFDAHFRQGMLGFSIDSFIQRFNPPFPNRLKIDVDGIEDKIIAGATATLADPRLRALSVELDDDRPDYRDAVVERIVAGGMTLVDKRHAAMFDQGAFKDIYNFHFVRP